jgi:hypothetical protein
MTIARCFPIALIMAGCTFAAPEGVAGDEDGDAGDPVDIPPAPEPVARHCSADQNDPDLVLCVDFEDPSLAQRALDGSKNPIDVTAVNVGSSMRIPSTEQAAEISLASTLDVPASPKLDLPKLTIEMWIRPSLDPFTSQGLFDNPGQYRMLYENRRQVRCGLAAASASIDSQDSLPLGRWSHVACRYDGKELRVYLNGHLSKCGTLPRGATTTSGGEAIGSLLQGVSGTRTHSSPFLGGVDNVRVYGRARTDADLCAAAGQPAGSCRTACPDDDRDGPGPGGPGPGGH